MAIKDALAIINGMQADGVISHYAIGGAVGATFYVEPAATVDLDIFVDLPMAAGSQLLTVSPIYDYLRGRGCKVEREFVVIADWPVQFLPVANDLDREALDEAVAIEMKGVVTRVMRPEHLMAIALRTGRAKDRARIAEFLDRKAFDPVKLKQVVASHGLLEKWEKITTPE